MKPGTYLAGGLLVVASACVDDTGYEDIPEADYGVFVDRVQPVLAERCANPSCHGTVRRPLEVYAPSFHRADPEMVHSSDPLTDAELRANFDRSRAFILGAERPLDTLLLSKPLAIAAGGTGHADVEVFETRDDTEYVRMLDWVEDALAGSEDPG